jgi:hypothetical protein
MKSDLSLDRAGRTVAYCSLPARTEVFAWYTRRFWQQRLVHCAEVSRRRCNRPPWLLLAAIACGAYTRPWECCWHFFTRLSVLVEVYGSGRLGLDGGIEMLNKSFTKCQS